MYAGKVGGKGTSVRLLCPVPGFLEKNRTKGLPIVESMAELIPLPMKSKHLLTLGLGLGAALFACGCATTPTHGGSSTSYLGGLVVVETDSFKIDDTGTDRIDGTKIITHGDPSGKSTSVLWGAITYTDY